MTYLRCISNKGFIWQQGKLVDEELASLSIGKLYVPALLRDILQAEALANGKPVSALLRE